MVGATGEAKKRFMFCITKLTSVDTFMEQYGQDLVTLPNHIFRATWQHAQMGICIETITEDDVCIWMDYAENYQVKFQGEFQSAFCDQNQVMVHPMMWCRGHVKVLWGEANRPTTTKTDHGSRCVTPLPPVKTLAGQENITALRTYKKIWESCIAIWAATAPAATAVKHIIHVWTRVSFRSGLHQP